MILYRLNLYFERKLATIIIIIHVYGNNNVFTLKNNISLI